jgi:O-antigen ligase
LHNPLLHEVTISSVMFFLAALNAAASRRIMALRRADLTNYICRK